MFNGQNKELTQREIKKCNASMQTTVDAEKLEQGAIEGDIQKGSLLCFIQTKFEV